ncbi:MAG: glycosyltransferase [Flavobacterium sp.]
MGLNKKIYIYALCDVHYDSYYLKGIKEVFSSYSFNINKFPKFRQGVFAVILSENNSSIKLIIDSRDTNEYNEEELNWCDVYGKVNYNLKNIPEKYKEKIKPIGPSFGIKIWNLPVTIFKSISNYLMFRKFVSNKREFFANYWRQYKRMPLERYQNSASLKKYIFFTGSIWKNESLTNKARAAFIKACKNNDKIVFEGGFAPRKDGNNLDFESLVVSKRFSLQEYLEKIKQSSIVFNTPAVLSCHGWKLAEFLALGKAIITTNHLNEFPVELENNVHAIYVDSNESIADKINLILSDEKLKATLEKNSKKYFDEYLAPKIVIERLLFK